MNHPEPFLAAPVIAGLTQFQRNTVEHVVERFYGTGGGRRFLVADETGLGKTMVARGVIARAIEELEHDRDVRRIDIVYVCSNTDIANQNLNALDVTGEESRGIASRLTLLAKHSRHLVPLASKFTKPVNLISFTPGTSFERGWQTGKSEERAMLYLLLEKPLNLTGARGTAAGRLLQGSVRQLWTFQNTIEVLRGELEGDIDATVEGAFLKAALREKLLDTFDQLVAEMGRRRSVPDLMHDEVRRVIGDMRSTLARESVQLLEPDLVILDEFQRFRHLLDPNNEAGELAHHLFEHEQARVLLLSATPYKPFTYAEEAADGGDDHHRNFMETVEFLAKPLEEAVADEISRDLVRYRTEIVAGRPVAEIGDSLRAGLLKVMTRTERPRHLAEAMSREDLRTVGVSSEEDLLGYVTLRELARLLGAPMTVDYWKSAPYFVNFMDGYKLAEKVREAIKDSGTAAEVFRLLGVAQHLTVEDLRSYRPVDMGNQRMRQLAEETVGTGWWKLLWISPSLPYLVPEGPFAEPFAKDITKRLIFSSWAATPTTIAALLSYDADRQIAEGSRLSERTPEARRALSSRLSYRMEGGRPQSMTTLALFWPMPELAESADPLKWCRRSGGPIDANTLVSQMADQLAPIARERDVLRGTAGEASYWIESVGRPTSRPSSLTVEQLTLALAGQADVADDDLDPDDQGNLGSHVAAVLEAEPGTGDVVAPDLAEVVAELAAHSPGNISYRALSRISAGSAVTQEGLWQAAAVLGSGLRSLFARPETMLLLDKLVPGDLPYWRAVLKYCAWGNLQAVMDEYIHHLLAAERVRELDDLSLVRLAEKAAAAISIRPARYEAFNPEDPTSPIGLTARFALRYGGRKQDQESVRQPQVRQAFNSPFWPFVLATTSVGQEGIDFHWWSHALLHWNTPANPVDFEQREGRIDRYDGHAVRRNIAERHGAAILAGRGPNPWQAAYELATDETGRLGEFAPHWVYPGRAKIERHVAPFGLSVDVRRLEAIKRDVALYRLTFGQPRQEDMLELLKQTYTDLGSDQVADLRIDLSAPQIVQTREGSVLEER